MPDTLTCIYNSLLKAKRKYEIQERKAQAAKARGQDTWMLPELSAKIDKESKVNKPTQMLNTVVQLCTPYD